jgi:hypothetical protein
MHRLARVQAPSAALPCPRQRAASAECHTVRAGVTLPAVPRTLKVRARETCHEAGGDLRGSNREQRRRQTGAKAAHFDAALNEGGREPPPRTRQFVPCCARVIRGWHRNRSWRPVGLLAHVALAAARPRLVTTRKRRRPRPSGMCGLLRAADKRVIKRLSIWAP